MKEYRELAESKNVQSREIDHEAMREKWFMYAIIISIIAVLPLIYYIGIGDSEPISVNPATMAAYASRIFYHF